MMIKKLKRDKSPTRVSNKVGNLIDDGITDRVYQNVIKKKKVIKI